MGTVEGQSGVTPYPVQTVTSPFNFSYSPTKSFSLKLPPWDFFYALSVHMYMNRDPPNNMFLLMRVVPSVNYCWLSVCPFNNFNGWISAQGNSSSSSSFIIIMSLLIVVRSNHTRLHNNTIRYYKRVRQELQQWWCAVSLYENAVVNRGIFFSGRRHFVSCSLACMFTVNSV